MYSQAALGPPFFSLLLACSGCAATVPVAGPDGASVRGDPAINAGLPVQLILRKADEQTLPLWQHSVTLAPGPHEFMVDCRVRESGATRRFVLRAELEPRGQYHFVATANTRNCESVEIQPR